MRASDCPSSAPTDLLLEDLRRFGLGTRGWIFAKYLPLKMACGVSSNGSRHIVGPKMIATVANGGGLTKSSTNHRIRSEHRGITLRDEAKTPGS
jgi:hypothetical protein